MRDSEVVASIVAGDANGLAEAYDRYAAALYQYCRSMLADEAGAADVVQDTFVLAASRLADLREPERLGAWLYAVARSECLRIPPARRTAAAPGRAPDRADDPAGAGDDAGRPGAAPGPPAEFRTHTLALAAGQDPGAAAHRAAVLGRAGSFGRDGFPRPARRVTAALARRAGASGGLRFPPRGRAAVAAGAALAAVIAVTAFALDGGPEHAKLADGQPSAPARSATAPAPGGALRSGGSATAAPSRAATRASARASASGSATTAAAVPVSPAPGQAASPAPETPPAPAPGVLAVWPPGGPLWILPEGGAIWLTAQGGPVTWWITVPEGYGDVNASPSSGTLAAGQSVRVTVTAGRFARDEQLTVHPSGTTFTIVTGWHHRFSLSAAPAGVFRRGHA
jgi:hypothetical protein